MKMKEYSLGLESGLYRYSATRETITISRMLLIAETKEAPIWTMLDIVISVVSDPHAASISASEKIEARFAAQ